MSDFEKRYSEIEEYLKGKLKGDALASFEAELKTNVALAEEVEVQRIARTAIEQVYLQEMSQIIREQSSRTNKGGNTWKYGIWGGAILLVVIGVLIFNNSPSQKEYSSSDSKRDKIVEKKKVETKKKLAPHNKNIRPTTHDKHLPQDKKETLEVIHFDTNADGSTIEDPQDTLITMQQTNTAQNSSVNVDTSTNEKTEHQNDDSNNTHPRIKKVTCDFSFAKITPQKASLGEENGGLILPEKEGFYYIINNGDIETETDIDGLSIGKYTVTVSNGKECQKNLGEFHIVESPCLKDKDYSYNIQYDDDFLIPLKENNQTEITIFSNIGRVIYKDVLENETEFEWNGQNINGENANLGLHKVVVKYNSKTSCIYNVVITE